MKTEREEVKRALREGEGSITLYGFFAAGIWLLFLLGAAGFWCGIIYLIVRLAG